MNQALFNLPWSSQGAQVEQADPVTGLFPFSDSEFQAIRDYLEQQLGISLCPAKKNMVAGRLRNRLKFYGLTSYGEYFNLVKTNLLPDEQQELFDCLTTNETFFFREASHFSFLAEQVLPQLPGYDIRVWSAACSSGEETYSLAMTLAHCLGTTGWELLGSDINRSVLNRAQKGHYPMLRHEGISEDFLSRYCLKGTGRYEGTFLIKESLRNKVRFKQVNLKASMAGLGKFDVIFLRNVLIYFEQATKLEIVRRVLGQLKTGGFLFISHTENLHGLDANLEMVKPSVFRKCKP